MTQFQKLSKEAEFIADCLLEAQPAKDGSLDGVNAHWAWRNLVSRFATRLHEREGTIEEQFKARAGFTHETEFGGYTGPDTVKRPSKAFMDATR